MKNSVLIIGIDGGASKVSAHSIDYNNDSFSLGKTNFTKEYKDLSSFDQNFNPVSLIAQLSQIKNNAIKLTQTEINQANAFYAAFVEVITKVVSALNPVKVIIGIGMPGIKSDDGRGIIAMVNGPRMPDFTSEIEKRLSDSGIVLALPIKKLGSDAYYCGIGEEHAINGAFKNVDNAYYLGGGTGVADALKLHGKLLALDDCKSWFAKTWEFKTENGISMENYCSANGIQKQYKYFAAKHVKLLVTNQVMINEIVDRAANGEKPAIDTLKIVNKNIALLLFERICTIYSGWQNSFAFIDSNRERPKINHKFVGTLLDRIIFGQRLGQTFSNQFSELIIKKPILNHLSKLVKESSVLEERAKSHYIKNGEFNNHITKHSLLREAPALGAGIEAWNNYAKK